MTKYHLASPDCRHPSLRTALPCTWWPLGDTQAAYRLYVSNNSWGPGEGRADSRDARFIT